MYTYSHNQELNLTFSYIPTFFYVLSTGIVLLLQNSDLALY